MIARCRIAFPMDTALPRDEMVISPCFTTDNVTQLTLTLKDRLVANTMIGAKPFTIKTYDAQKAPPSYPLATAEQTGTPPTTDAPREIALCLSYYATWNRPRFRGRLYIPHALFGGTTPLRPDGIAMAKVRDFGLTLSQGYPAGTFWTIYSRVANAGAQVTNWYVDDEWDTVRSRGLKPTTRSTSALDLELDTKVPANSELLPPPAVDAEASSR